MAPNFNSKRKSPVLIDKGMPELQAFALGIPYPNTAINRACFPVWFPCRWIGCVPTNESNKKPD